MTDPKDATKPARDFRDDRLVLIAIPTETELQRRDELDERIHELALTPRYKPLVDRIRCFWGFKTQAAMVLATELGDVRRFESPRQLMAYVGLVPREHSSGDRRRLGGITKAGNARARHVLIQAAWHYRKRPSVGPTLRKRQRGQDPDVIRHAWKCQHRLYTLNAAVCLDVSQGFHGVSRARSPCGRLPSTCFAPSRL